MSYTIGRRTFLTGTAGVVAGVGALSGTASAGVGSRAGVQDVYLLIGQSNMAGRAPIQAQDVDAPPGVMLFNAADTWQAAANEPYGLNRYSTVRKQLSVQRLGPGHAFGARIASVTGRIIGLVVNARGGTKIAQWRTADHDGDFPLYAEAVARASAALAVSAGATLAGIIWHQGEGDNNSGAAETYLPTLATIVDGLRSELGAPSAPFVAGEVGTWNGRGQHINPLIRQVPDVIDNAAWVSAEGLTSLNLANNDPHFDSPSQRTLGRRYADAVLALE